MLSNMFTLRTQKKCTARPSAWPCTTFARNRLYRRMILQLRYLTDGGTNCFLTRVVERLSAILLGCIRPTGQVKVK
jgi:hypothetical protein